MLNLNYYDEIKNSILETLEDKYSNAFEFLKENKDLSEYDIYDYLLGSFWNDDYITGNASGSYYFSTYKSRKHCYNFFRDVQEALQECGYNGKLQRFKIFVNLVEEGYLNIENMTLNDEKIEELDNKLYILEDFKTVEDLNFELLDVITRCFKMPEVLWDVLDSYLD